jgi:DNA-binding HxlR family transcriptional regulator
VDPAANFCPRYLHAVELVGRRWTGVILRALLAGPARYNEIRAGIPDLSDRMLSERLKELECEGVVVRSVIPESPVRVEYALTEKGRALESAVLAIAQWAERWVTAAPAPGEPLAPGLKIAPPAATSTPSADVARKPRVAARRSRG